MKEIFGAPVYEIVLFTREDVVCASQNIIQPQNPGVPGPGVDLP